MIINRKRLNNKGFTLVELLAVVVILAVVMSIAATQVLSSMNNSKKGSLNNSAKSVSQAFQTKYSEAMVTGSAAEIYKDIMGTVGYDFNTATPDSPKFYYLSEGLKDELNLSPAIYRLTTAGSISSPEEESSGGYEATESFVAFNGSTVVVCMIAKQSGSYYVADFTKKKSATVLGKTVNFSKGTGESGEVMWACSTDATNSWTQ